MRSEVNLDSVAFHGRNARLLHETGQFLQLFELVVHIGVDLFDLDEREALDLGLKDCDLIVERLDRTMHPLNQTAIAFELRDDLRAIAGPVMDHKLGAVAPRAWGPF